MEVASKLQDGLTDNVNRHSHSTRKAPVVDIATGKVFDSLSEAAVELGVSNASVVWSAIKNKRLLKGRALGYADGDELPDIGEYREPVSHAREVVELGSGKVFGSLTEAAGFAGVSGMTVYRAIAGKRSVQGCCFWPVGDEPYPDAGDFRDSDFVSLR